MEMVNNSNTSSNIHTFGIGCRQSITIFSRQSNYLFQFQLLIKIQTKTPTTVTITSNLHSILTLILVRDYIVFVTLEQVSPFLALRFGFIAKP